MESTKSAFAENHLFETSDNILINFTRLQRDSNIISDVLLLVVLALASVLTGENHTFCEHYNMN